MKVSFQNTGNGETIIVFQLFPDGSDGKLSEEQQAAARIQALIACEDHYQGNADGYYDPNAKGFIIQGITEKEICIKLDGFKTNPPLMRTEVKHSPGVVQTEDIPQIQNFMNDMARSLNKVAASASSSPPRRGFMPSFRRSSNRGSITSTEPASKKLDQTKTDASEPPREPDPPDKGQKKRFFR